MINPVEQSTLAQTSDMQAIEKLVAGYIEAARTGDNEAMKTFFHDHATICGYVGPDLFCGPIQMFYEWNAENGAAPSVSHRVTAIDVAESIASARFEIEDWTGHRFTDYFNLVKIDGEWTVLSKVFHLHG